MNKYIIIAILILIGLFGTNSQVNNVERLLKQVPGLCLLILWQQLGFPNPSDINLMDVITLLDYIHLHINIFIS